MSTSGGVGGIGPILEKAQRVAEEVPNNLREFEQVLSQLEQSQQSGAVAGGAASQQQGITISGAQTGSDLRVHEITGEKSKIAQTPDGLRKLSGEIEGGYTRLNDLIHELQSGKSYTPQELLAVQGQMHDLTLQIEVTTKVVSEAVSGLKQLMQQQV